MFVKSFKFFYFYTFSTLFLTLLILFFLNPTLYNYGIYSYRSFVFIKPNFFIINKDTNLIKGLKDSSVQYRNDADRTGFYEIDFDPLSLKSEMLNDTIVNHGGHGASKSTPVSNGKFMVSAGDQGLIQVFKQEKLHWSLHLYNSNLGFHGTPIVFNDYAIIGEYSGRLYLLNLEAKKIIWMAQLGNSFGATPWLESHYLYYNVETLHPNGYIGKINLSDTSLVWASNPIGNHSHSSPAVDNENLYFGDNDNKFQAMSKTTGTIMWEIKLAGPIKSTPAMDNENIYISSWDGHLYSLKKANGLINWQYKLSEFNQSSPAIDQKLSFGFINDQTGVHKIDLKTGQRLAFHELSMSKETKRASPVILKYKSKKYVATPCAKTDVCIYDFVSFKLLKKYSFNEGLSSQVGVDKKYLIIALNKKSPIILLRP